MGKRKQKKLTLTVEKLAFGGRGFSRYENRVVFIDGAIPGDTAEVLVTRKKKDYLEAKVTRIIEPSPLRIDAPCPYFKYCGGCKWQFLPYEHQLQFKQDLVKESLERIGKFSDIPMENILPSPQTYRYRNKMEFSFSQRRWLTPEELQNKEISMQFALGLHVPGTFDKVMDIDACLLQSEPADTILQRVKQWAKNSGIEAYHLRNQTGILRFLVIRHARKSGEIMINLVTTESVEQQLKPFAEKLAADLPEITSVINSINNRQAQIAFGDEEIIVYGKPTITDHIGDLKFEISANAFFQTNTEQAERLYETVADFADLTGDETIFDLYSGTGTIAIFLAQKAKKVIGIELIEDAVINAKKNAIDNEIHNCEFHQGDMKEALQLFRDHAPDVLVVDPPRAGLHKKAIEEIIQLSPQKIVYVSCNPSTLARDLDIMRDHYALKRVKPVDMFPHTWHIETVTLLERIHA